MATASQILARLQSQLALTDSTWDITVGTPEYKILEAVASELATAANNSTLQSYSFDINTKSGSALDQYVSLFGMYRLLGYSATGTVTFSTSSAASANYYIPMGTQVYVPPQAGNSTNAVYYQTQAPALILQNTTSAEVPIEATQPGVNGNVPSGAITSTTSGLTGITSISNTNPTAGGSDPETDAQLRARWSATVFRNLAGTEDQFLSVALGAAPVTLANVIGPQVRIEEQDQITGGFYTYTLGMTATGGSFTISWNGGTTETFAYNILPATLQSDLQNTSNWTVPPNNSWLSTLPTVTGTAGVTYSLTLYSNMLPTVQTAGLSGGTATLSPISGTLGTVTALVVDPAYFYPEGGELVGVNVGSSNQSLMVVNTDYSYGVTAGPPPTLTLTISNGSQNPAWDIGQTIDFQYEYTPKCSRNTPGTNPPITNKVDIFVNGSISQQVTEEIIFNTTATFVGSGATNYEVLSGNFLQEDGASTPTVGDIYMQLFQQPALIEDFPDSISVGAYTYYLGATRSASRSDANPVSYYWVNDITTNQGSPLSGSGIAWIDSGGSGPPLPANGTLIPVTYNYNSLISDLNDLMQQVRLVGSDCLVHAAAPALVSINIVVIYGIDQNVSVVNSAITTALETYFSTQQFLGAIRASDVIQTVMGVSGVVNARMTRSTSPSDNATGGGINNVAVYPSATPGTNIVNILAQYPPNNTNSPSDFYLNSNQLPELYQVNALVRSQNSF